MKVVAGWVATRASKESMIRSNEGNAARSPTYQSGFASSSSSRSFVPSSGWKKATGSATWIVTGMPKRAAVSQRGPSRRSSGISSSPRSSRIQTELLPDLQPARAGEDAAFELRRESVAEPCLLGDGPVQLAEREEPVRMGVSCRSRLARSSSPCSRRGSRRWRRCTRPSPRATARRRVWTIRDRPTTIARDGCGRRRRGTEPVARGGREGEGTSEAGTRGAGVREASDPWCVTVRRSAGSAGAAALRRLAWRAWLSSGCLQNDVPSDGIL